MTTRHISALSDSRTDKNRQTDKLNRARRLVGKQKQKQNRKLKQKTEQKTETEKEEIRICQIRTGQTAQLHLLALQSELVDGVFFILDSTHLEAPPPQC